MDKLEVINADDNIIKTQLAKFNKSDEVINELNKNFKGLMINGINDKAGFKVVYDARMVVRNHRIEIEKKRKELKANVLEVGKAIDGEAKRLTGMLEPLEEELQKKEDTYHLAVEEARLAAEKKESERLQVRVDALSKYGFRVELDQLKAISDEIFDSLLSDAKQKFEADQKAKEEKALADQKEAEAKAELERVEKERLEKQRIEQEAEAARLKEIQDKIDAEREIEQKRLKEEQDKLEAEKAELKRQQDEFAANQLAEQNRLKAIQEAKDLEEKQKAEALAEEEKQATEMKQAEEQRALRAPDKEKLEVLLESLRGIKFPEMTSEAGKNILTVYKNAFNAAAINLKKQTEAL